jgi:hypothetical protein
MKPAAQFGRGKFRTPVASHSFLEHPETPVWCRLPLSPILLFDVAEY